MHRMALRFVPRRSVEKNSKNNVKRGGIPVNTIDCYIFDFCFFGLKTLLCIGLLSIKSGMFVCSLYPRIRENLYLFYYLIHLKKL